MATHWWHPLIPKRHWSAHYLTSRIRLAIWQRRHSGTPWLCPSSVRFLDEWLTRDDRVVEFGSGRSTRWFAERAGQVTSIEHNAEWYEEVRSTLEPHKNATIIKVANNSIDYLAPLASLALPPTLVLVDGRHRAECALWALEKIATGGLIVIDDAQRYLSSTSTNPDSIGGKEPPSPEWREFQRAISPFRKIWHDCGVSNTVIVFVERLPRISD